MSEETKDHEKEDTTFEPDDNYQGSPVFDVDQQSFFKNMRTERNKTQFPDGSKPAQFMQNTTSRQTFYVRYTDKQGQKFMKKFK